MMLAAIQRGFMAEIAGDDAAPPSSLGMAIYRNAYRARLVQALETSFERTRDWIGEDAFATAAAHYILTHPPIHWSLDAFGDRFPEELGLLFAQDPEVAELAWLEWHMQLAFADRDRGELTAETLGAMELGDTDWEDLRLTPAGGFRYREIGHDLAPLWRALSPARDSAATTTQPSVVAEPSVLVVWRHGLAPRFRQMAHDEFAALRALADGGTFGEVAAHQGEAGLARFGQWFAQWLAEGLFGGLAR